MYTKLLVKNLYLTLKYIKHLNAKSGVLTLQSFDSLALRKASDYLLLLDKCYSNFFNKIFIYLYEYIIIHSTDDTFITMPSYTLNNIYNLMFCLLNDVRDSVFLVNNIHNFELINASSYKTLALLNMISVFELHNYNRASLKVAHIPKKIRKFTVLRSPHVDKKSREQFELRRFKCASKIFNNQVAYLNTLCNMRLPSGIGISISYTKNRI